MRPKTICFFSVRMKRSATPLVLGSREGEAGRHAEEPQLVLEVPGHEGPAVVLTQQHPPRGIGADGAEDPADGQRQRLGGSITVAVPGDVPADTLRRSSARRR